MLQRLSIRQKILGIVLLPILLAIATAVMAVFQLNHTAAGMKATINDQGLVATEYILNADRDIYQALNNVQEMSTVPAGSPRLEELKASYAENVGQTLERLGLAEEALSADRALWEKFTGPANGKTIFDNFDSAITMFTQWGADVDALIAGGSADGIYDGDYMAEFEEARAYINEITDTMKLALEDEMANEMAGVRNLALGMTVAAAVGLAAVLALTLVVTSRIVRSVRAAAGLIGELGKGHLGKRAAVGDRERDEVAAMIRGMNGFADHLQHQVVGVMQRIARGELTATVGAADADDEIAPALQQTLDSLKALVKETGTLTEAASRGALDVRGDAGRLQGAYADVVGGINATLDGIIRPVQEARAVLGRLAVNDLEKEMSDSYRGMLAELARDINQVRDNLLDVQDALVRSSRGDIGRLEEFEKLGRRSPNDRLTPSILAVYQSIRDITGEAGTLTGAALNGNLALRADLSRFQGGYRSIVEGFNQTIDALVRPIQEASAVIQQIAVGNLTVRMDGAYKGDHAVIKDSLNAALDTFSRLLGDIRQASEEVATGSQQLAGSSQALSQGATEQASAIEQISASIEELAVQTRQNAGSAGTASELSAQARTSALHGNERMRSMLDSMNSINESSANISKIIKVIDDIAFQTNILALNAAVEAARAGQYGRGFAVVAEEVRSLAARSAEAAKETTLMIENSIKRVNDGTSIANVTAEALEEIVDKVGQATDLVMSISESSNEQAGGIVQINEALSQVSKVVQMNSSAAEQSASSSEELTGQAGMLREMAQRFRLRD